MPDNEKQFESDIESFLISPDGGWTKASDAGYRSTASTGKALDLETLVGFVKETQPLVWQRFESSAAAMPYKSSTAVLMTLCRNPGLSMC